MVTSSAVPRRSALFHTAAIFGFSLGQYVVAFAASALISRSLGPHLRGVYYLPVLVAATVTVVGKMGIDQANVYLHATRGVALARLSAQNGLVALIAGVVGCVFTLSLPWILPAVFGDTPVVFLFLAGLTIPFAIHSQFCAGLLSLAGRPTAPFRAGLIGSVCQVSLLIALILSEAVSVTAILLVAVITGVVSWGVIAHAVGEFTDSWIGWDPTLIWSSLRSSLVLHAGMLLLFLHLRLDMFMVEAWMGPEALGHYSLSVILSETLMLATDAVALAILPGQVANTLAEAGARALRAARANLVIGASVATAWAIVGGTVVRVIFGAEYMPAVLPMLVLLPGMVLLGMQRVAGAPVLRAGRPGIMLSIYLASLTCNLVLNTLWIPRWGLVGASAASTVSYTISTVLFLAWVARLAGAPLLPSLVPSRNDVAALWAATSAWRGRNNQVGFPDVNEPPPP